MKKFLKNIKVIIILLIIVTILFALLGSFKILENMEDSAPLCYSSVLDDISDNQSAGYASYNIETDDKYILKTKIVPPKGTACPTELSGPASKYLNSVSTISESEKSDINISSSNTSSSNTNSFQSITNTSILPTSSTPQQHDPSAPSPAGNIASSPALVNESKNESKNEKKSDSCPPCPACERCPEPAFDCKKVPNYRSPNIGQYLPMPILNDFSTF